MNTSERITESTLAEFWRSGALRGKELRDAQGRRLRVLHPGVADCGGGPDFRDAAIALPAGPGCAARRGDVEIHTDSRLWRQHGHHHDPRFNGVILHVVLDHNPKTPTLLESGSPVPVLQLGPLLRQGAAGCPSTAPSPPPCRRSCRDAALAATLERAGGERLRLRADGFGAQINASGPGQALYLGIMEAMGYAGNRRPFRTLACRAPLSLLENLSSLVSREALLFGAAGLLPQQRRPQLAGLDAQVGAPLEDWELRLEQEWAVICEGVSAMDARDWDLVHVRPSNSPLRRLAAMARLVRAGPGDLLCRLMEAVKCAEQETLASTLDYSLIIVPTGRDYWADHWDFGRRTAPERGRALLGEGRAADIVVNAVLPFALAWSERREDCRLRGAALSLYREHPALAPNRVTRCVSSQVWGGTRSPGLSAAQQQGLIHLYRNFCSLGRCAACPLARSG